MTDKDLVQVMIESVEPEFSYFQNFWAHAKHPGEAIEKILRACLDLGIQDPVAAELDWVDASALPDDVIHDEELGVFYSPVRYSFPSEKSFRAPFGIINSSNKGELDYELIREGYSLGKTKDGIYEIDAAVEGERLFNTFIELVKRLSSIKVFWLVLAADWEDKGREEFWTNEKLNTAKRIESYLTSRWNDTVANGHVALTAYDEVGQTNLSIDTHKTIKVLTKSSSMQRKLAAGLRSLKFEELPKFHSLEIGFYHWHYRPTESKSRDALVAALKKDGFELWRSQAADTR